MLQPEQITEIQNAYQRAIQTINSESEIFYPTEKNWQIVRSFLVTEKLPVETWNEFLFQSAILEWRRQKKLEQRPPEKSRAEKNRVKELKDRAPGRQHKAKPEEYNTRRDIANSLKSFKERLQGLVTPEVEYQYTGSFLNHARTKRK